MQICLEKKFSSYVFLRIMEIIEVTQEINSTGIIPLEALRAHLPKRPHIWWRIQSGIFQKTGNHIVLVTPYTPAKKRGRIEISAKFSTAK